jgi:phage shock protein C
MAKKRLQRDQEQAVISGVVAGLAEYFNQDPVLFRVVAIAFLLLTGVFPGLIIYIAAWIIMPRKQPPHFDYEVHG